MINISEEAEGVYVLRLDEDENRFGPYYLEAVGKCLDAVEDLSGPAALVTTGTGKFFSNGLDLDWLTRNGDKADRYLHDVQEIFARLLSLPVPTVAAVNGHAFAGGAMLALAHDFVVMRSDRGWFCLPEVDLGMPFTPGMASLIQARLSTSTAREAMLTARRYTGEEAVSAGIAERAEPEKEVLPRALEIAAGLAPKAGRTYAAIRKQMYADTITALRGPLH